MTLGLACDRDGYDLRIPPCGRCGSRGCFDRKTCKLNPEMRIARSGPPTPRPERVPNRLYGATINHEGDAV